MENLILNLLLIDSILIVIAVMMQPSKQQDALSALSGGSGDLFGKQKARGFEASCRRVTVDPRNFIFRLCNCISLFIITLKQVGRIEF